MGNVIGIDLGTTNSAVAHLEGGRPLVMPNAEGSKTTPSVVLFREDGEVIVGEMAKRQRLLSPKRTIYSVKRFVGCRWDEAAERRRGIEYDLAEGPESLVTVRIGEQTLLPEEVQAHTLMKMKATAEDYLGEAVTQAVITCPAYFNDSQRQATKRAAELAGLEALRIINEPTAAALAYGMDKLLNEKIAVFDFGGGTFDISILEIEKDVFEVKSTCGDTFLGGDCIDRMLTEYLLGKIQQELGVDLGENPQSLSRVAEAAERAKCELSFQEQSTIALPFIWADAAGPRHFNATLRRADFEELIAPVLARLEAPCRQALDDARVRPDQLGAVILVGGSTRIPAVRRLVRELFGREPNHSVHPDEAVALGAAMQAGVLSGELDEILLLDVTPLSLGIELAGGVFSSLIQRNSSIPTTAMKKFTTVRDNQTSVKVHVLQGERKMARQNRTLARFRLEGIDPSPREVPEIEVNFQIDANGILHVTAMDLTSGNMTQVKVESYRPELTGDAKQLVEDAHTAVDEDRQFMRKLKARRRVDEYRQEMTRLRTDREAKPLSEEQEKRLYEALFRLEVLLQQDDFALIEEADRELQSVFSEIMMLSGMSMASAADELLFESSSINLKASETTSRAPAAGPLEISPSPAIPSPPGEHAVPPPHMVEGA